MVKGLMDKKIIAWYGKALGIDYRVRAGIRRNQQIASIHNRKKKSKNETNR